MKESYLEPEYEPHFTAWKADPNPDNASKLLKSIHPVLTSALRSYGTVKSPTLMSKAKILALDAMNRYDPSKAKLRTHLIVQLQGLRRHSAQESQILSVPEQVGLDLTHLRESENYLKDKFGRDPSNLEIADHTGLSLKRIGYIRKSRPSYAEGYYHKSTSEGEDIYSPAVQNQNGTSQWYEFVYHDLAPEDQLILEHTLGLHGKRMLSNQDIARKLRMTPGAISQKKAKIQEKINMRESLGIF